MVVNGKNFVLNPDAEHRKTIQEGLKSTGGYCPCSIVQNEDTKCPCKNFRENGDCHCMLWVEQK